MNFVLKSALGAAFAVLAGTTAALAEYPERAVTIIVPWSAGGGTDGTARAVAAELEKRLGQPFNVVNRTGGGGLVGHSAIAQAEPDGYTLGVITIEVAMYAAQGLQGATPEDYTFIGRFNADPIAVNIRTDAEYDTLDGLIEAIRADPGAVAVSGANWGGLSHLAWVGMLNKLEIDPMATNWIASDGSAPALQQLAAGAIDVVSTSPAEARALVDAGEVKTLALMSSERSTLYPGLPTTDELLNIQWSPLPFRGMAGPEGLPQDVVDTISATLKEITEDTSFQDFMSSQGYSVAYQDTSTFSETVLSARDGLTETMSAVGLGQ